MSNVEQWEHNEQRAMETEITTLREQVEKLTEECVVLRASNRTKLDTIAYLETREDENKQKLAALAEQNEKMREACEFAANALENIASTSSSTRIRRVANEALKAIRARRN